MSRTAIFHFSSLLRNCVPLSLISQTKQIHAQILIHGFLPDVTLETDILLAYCKCGSLQYARQIFDEMCERNMHSWNILISSYVQNSMYLDAFSVFTKFRGMGRRPDHYTLPPVFKACAGTGDIFLGKVIHGWVIRLGFDDYVVVGSSVLDFYLKCGNLSDGRRVFLNMTWRDSAVWNSMISGFGREGLYVEALNFFRNMIGEGFKMDAMTIPSILSACGGEGDLMKGKEIHGQVIKSLNFDRDVAIRNSLIDMYAKCGCLHDSKRVFNKMCELNMVTWTTMICCYGVHGKGEESLVLYKKMIDCGFEPNSVTLTAILASCSHSSLIDQGRRIFDSIDKPSPEHYACMVDLLGRCGYLDEALTLANTMKLEATATASVWGALLAGCMMHQNVQIGEIAAYHLFELEPRNSSNYIALCCIYESLGISDGVSLTRAKMRELGLVKTPGCSWVTVAGKIHKFYQGDHFHPFTQMIHETLDRIIKSLMLPDYYEEEG